MCATIAAVVVAALAILVVVSLLARRAVGDPVLSRLRALLPAWRLFDRAAPSPVLLIRWSRGRGFTAWSPLDPAPERRPRDAARWAFAPRANLALACQSAIEQLVAELAELDLPDGAADTDPAIVERTSYALVGRIARAHLPAGVRGQPGARFQWKLVVPASAGAGDSLESVELAA